MTLVTGKVASLADNPRQKPTQNPHQEMTTMLDPTVRRVLDGTSLAHLASVLPDGAPTPSLSGSPRTATTSRSSPARAPARPATCAATHESRSP